MINACLVFSFTHGAGNPIVMRETKGVIVVSGLPRSGTSLVMQMLAAGGVRAVTDEVRRPDADNPRGYFEHEGLKARISEPTWIELAEGGAIKVISPLVFGLPDSHRYDVIFVLRRIDEVLASQRRMLANLNRPDDGDDAGLARLFAEHIVGALQWLSAQPHMRVLTLDHADCIHAPARAVASITAFLGRELDGAAMAAAVDRALYRNRGSSCRAAHP